MKKSEIEVGRVYLANVSGQVARVRVTAIRPSLRFGESRTVYDVTNLGTGRKMVFKSSARFRSAIASEPPVPKEMYPAGSFVPGAAMRLG